MNSAYTCKDLYQKKKSVSQLGDPKTSELQIWSEACLPHKDGSQLIGKGNVL